jgi:hypothetical protein
MSRWICTGCGYEAPSREALWLACPELYHDHPQCENRSLWVEQLALPETAEEPDGATLASVRGTR